MKPGRSQFDRAAGWLINRTTKRDVSNFNFDTWFVLLF